MLASASRAIEGSLPLGAKHRAATLYSVGSRSDPDHEATLRFDGEAPRWWAHSVGGLGAIARVGSPPPRIVRGALPRCTRPAPNDGFAGLSCRRAQDETSARNTALTATQCARLRDTASDNGLLERAK